MSKNHSGQGRGDIIFKHMPVDDVITWLGVIRRGNPGCEDLTRVSALVPSD